ncbi:twin-arginine translocase subunit TatC [Halopenitus sp. H-Gu1]|uniref:twin-arginine translocase subunit TatC n=1 Tax=Halopenitus sp. H-Gu1 TaxID=3242697 RepID=UPI00359DCABD
MGEDSPSRESPADEPSPDEEDPSVADVTSTDEDSGGSDQPDDDSEPSAADRRTTATESTDPAEPPGSTDREDADEKPKEDDDDGVVGDDEERDVDTDGDDDTDDKQDEPDGSGDEEEEEGTDEDDGADADEDVDEESDDDDGDEEVDHREDEQEDGGDEQEDSRGSNEPTVSDTEPDDPLVEGPDTDEEMPLAAHIEEMMRRLGIVFLVAGIAILLAFPSASDLINYFWSYHIPDPSGNRPRLYGPLELVLTRLKVAGLAGVVVGLPVFVYQTYRFMRPGLYRRERRYYLAAVPTSLVLGTIGILFAHFLVLPAIFSYFTTYTSDAAVIAFGLAETFNLIIVMMSFMAIVFQIPLFIMLAIMMGLVTRQWLQDKRLIFWGAFLGIAFLFSPDPTGMAPIIVTLTMIGLYEGTLALLRWTGN